MEEVAHIDPQEAFFAAREAVSQSDEVASGSLDWTTTP